MKYLVLAIFMVSCAPNPMHLNGKMINEIPMYGGVEKPKAAKEADEKFKKHILSKYTKDSAANGLAQDGWYYFKNGDISTSIKRFNQCWLIDSTNGNCYWGFGVIVGREGKYDSALGFLQKANSILPNNTSLELDLAIGYYAAAGENKNNAIQYKERGEGIFEKQSRNEVKDEKLYCMWALVKGEGGDKNKACELMKSCEKDLDNLNKKYGCK